MAPRLTPTTATANVATSVESVTAFTLAILSEGNLERH